MYRYTPLSRFRGAAKRVVAVALLRVGFHQPASLHAFVNPDSSKNRHVGTSFVGAQKRDERHLRVTDAPGGKFSGSLTKAVAPSGPGSSNRLISPPDAVAGHAYVTRGGPGGSESESDRIRDEDQTDEELFKGAHHAVKPGGFLGVLRENEDVDVRHGRLQKQKSQSPTLQTSSPAGEQSAGDINDEAPRAGADEKTHAAISARIKNSDRSVTGRVTTTRKERGASSRAALLETFRRRRPLVSPLPVAMQPDGSGEPVEDGLVTHQVQKLSDQKTFSLRRALSQGHSHSRLPGDPGDEHDPSSGSTLPRVAAPLAHLQKKAAPAAAAAVAPHAAAAAHAQHPIATAAPLTPQEAANAAAAQRKSAKANKILTYAGLGAAGLFGVFAAVSAFICCCRLWRNQSRARVYCQICLTQRRLMRAGFHEPLLSHLIAAAFNNKVEARRKDSASFAPAPKSRKEDLTLVAELGWADRKMFGDTSVGNISVLRVREWILKHTNGDVDCISKNGLPGYDAATSWLQLADATRTQAIEEALKDVRGFNSLAEGDPLRYQKLLQDCLRFEGESALDNPVSDRNYYEVLKQKRWPEEVTQDGYLLAELLSRVHEEAVLSSTVGLGVNYADVWAGIRANKKR